LIVREAKSQRNAEESKIEGLEIFIRHFFGGLEKKTEKLVFGDEQEQWLRAHEEKSEQGL
jgi:hypothetical protein